MTGASVERKILVAVDKSSYCQNILTYLCALFGRQAGISFHLLSIVPHYAAEAASDWQSPQDLLASVSPETRKKYQACKSHLENARSKLLAAGFAEGQLETSVRLARAGVVADIVHEARSGLYDAIAIGKKDLSLLERMVAGSVSAEVLKKNRGLPVWVISGKVESRKIIFPVDCTLDAADHLGFMLKGNPEVEITLFHSCSLLASEKITPREEFYEKWGREWCDQHLRGEEGGHYHFSAPEQILREAGFPPDRVHRLTSESGIEPGQMIVHHVKHDGYGTIVMGRRHQDVDKGIFQGVSDRVLANVTDVALWIVG